MDRERFRGWLDAYFAAWVDGPPQVEVRWSHEALAVTGGRGIAQWRVSFGDQAGGRTELDGILLIDFDDRDRCVAHREWFEKRTLAGAAAGA